MNSPLRESIRTLATKFADELLGLVWNGLSDQLAPSDPPAGALARGGRRPRRSAEDIGAAADRILATLAKSAGGLRAEVLRARVGMSRPALGRPPKMLLASGRVQKTGQKRATVYLLGTSAEKGRAAAAPAPAARAKTEKRTAAKAAKTARKATARATTHAHKGTKKKKKATGRPAAKKPATARAATKAAMAEPAKAAVQAAGNGAGAKPAEA